MRSQSRAAIAGEIQQFEPRALLTGTVGIGLGIGIGEGIGTRRLDLTFTGDGDANDIKIIVNDKTGVTALGFVNTFGENGSPVNLTTLTFNGHTYKKGESVTLVSAEYLGDYLGHLLGELTVKMNGGNDKFELDVNGLAKLTIGRKLSIDLGSGNDAAYVNHTGSVDAVVGDASISGGPGDDYVSFNASGSPRTVLGGLLIDTGPGSDDVQLHWSTLNVTKDETIITGDGSDNVYQSFNNGGTFGGNVKIDTGNGNDYVNFNKENFGSLRVFGNMTIKAGEGDNDVKLDVNSLIIGDASKAAVINNLNIETGGGTDSVNVSAALNMLTGGINIATGAGTDDVAMQINVKAVQDEIPGGMAKHLTIDTANSLTSLGKANAEDDGDSVYVGFNSNFEVKGNVDIMTFGGSDVVEFTMLPEFFPRFDPAFNEVTVTINGDLKIDSGDGSDVVSMNVGQELLNVPFGELVNGASLLVKGNVTVNLDGVVANAADGDDRFIAGKFSQNDIALTSELGKRQHKPFTIVKNFTVNAGQGDDIIGLNGITVGKVVNGKLTGGNLTLNGDKGDDVIGCFALQIGGNLTVSGGVGNDDILFRGTAVNPFAVNGNTKINGDAGDDTVVVSGDVSNSPESVSFVFHTITINLGAGNDSVALLPLLKGAEEFFEEDVPITIDGGSGRDLRLTANLPARSVVKNFEGVWNSADANDAQDGIIAIMIGLLIPAAV